MSWALVFRIRQYLKGSLWALPALGFVLGVGLAGLDDRLERSIQVPDSWQYSSSTAASALTSIVAATVALLRRIERRGAVDAEIAALDAVVRRTFQDPAER